MNSTQHYFSALLIAGGAFCVASCTGDPTSGGIFWSESKAQARQASLLQEMNFKKAQAQQESAKSRKLLAKRNQLRAAQAKLSALPAESPEAAAERASIEAEIRKVERDISILQGGN